jgi:Ca2+-binding RTX toxin-like protein
MNDQYEDNGWELSKDGGVYRCSVKLPNAHDVAGVQEFKAYARVGDEIITSARVYVTVVPPMADLIGIKIRGDSEGVITMDNSYNRLRVAGVFRDGREYDITHPSAGTTYQSLSPSIAEVTAKGRIDALALGSADIVARNRGHEAVFHLRILPRNLMTTRRPGTVGLRYLGTAEDERLVGTFKDDTLRGGFGDDILIGLEGNDAYVWNFGYENDTIIDSAGEDVLILGNDKYERPITPGDVSPDVAGATSMDLVFRMSDGGSVTVRDWFAGEANQLVSVTFTDGTVWTGEWINSLFEETEPLMIEGTIRNDVLSGDKGNDTISAKAGNDTLYGGWGDDRLEGGVGDDAFIYESGDGRDTIFDNIGSNVLILGEGISPDRVKFTRSGGNFLDAVFILPNRGSVTVEGWFNSLGTYQLSEIRFHDGTVWTKEYINNLKAVFEGTDGNDNMSGSPGGDIMYGHDGDDTINGQAGDDTLIGGEGDDYLQGWSGNDTYIWDVWDGNDSIYSQFGGDNALELGKGVDPVELSFSKVSNDLVIRLNDASNATLTLKAWYSGSEGLYQLSRIVFAEGTVWTKADINEIAAGKKPFSNSPTRGTKQSRGGGSMKFGGCGSGAMGLASLLVLLAARRR